MAVISHEIQRKGSALGHVTRVVTFVKLYEFTRETRLFQHFLTPRSLVIRLNDSLGWATFICSSTATLQTGPAEEATGFCLRRDPDIATCDLLSQISEKDWQQRKKAR